VLIVDAFHHFPDQWVVLREVARVLREGGVVVISDFDPTTIRGRAIAIGERLIGMRSRFHSPADLRDQLRAANLEPVTVETGFTYTVVGRKS
jgi:demethylmenaquinone methyltransferase/2-methoxy-6-polyprenyl-1,4-benzoquinol methylase